ncbi:MAG: hypothetical protein NTX76_02870 [Alphaproteobacteria bacterium]|nr:hypothetical protein [Alphaproteobacteria bacterium]
MVNPQGQMMINGRANYDRNRDAIFNIIEQYVPPQERQNQRHGQGAAAQPQGLAFEIHNYSDTAVTSSASGSASPRTQKLIDAVWSNLERRIQKPMPYAAAQDFISKTIDQFIPKEQWALAKQAAFYRLADDRNYEQQLSLAATFIQTLHPEVAGQWIQGFVLESITAYQNSSNPESCSKGIRERIATGLRGIDSELDALFAQPEGKLLMHKWLNIWNLQGIDDTAKQRLAEQLKTEGVNSASTAIDAAKAFRIIARKQLEAHGLQSDPDELASVEAIADMVQEHYEAELKRFM